MPTTPPASLSFLPWVRQGAASAIATVDTLGSKQAAVADVSITLRVNNAPLPAVVGQTQLKKPRGLALVVQCGR